MSATNEDIAKVRIHYFVWSGFYTQNEIGRILFEDIFDGNLDESWVANAVQSEMARKTVDENQWPEKTDCDRLDAAFNELNRNGVIALQNAGYEQSDGITDISERYDELGGPNSNVIGYCFYHGQDLEHALNGNGLFLTYGEISGAHDKGIEIGQRICDALTKAGLTVKWSGSIEDRIEIPKIQWRRRTPM